MSTAVPQLHFRLLSKSWWRLSSSTLRKEQAILITVDSSEGCIKMQASNVIPCDSETQLFFGGDLGRIPPSTVKLGLGLAIKLVAIHK